MPNPDTRAVSLLHITAPFSAYRGSQNHDFYFSNSFVSKNPKFLNPTLWDLPPRVLAAINGFDPLGKSRIAISICSILLSMEIPMTLMS